jgi:hypothetical protein
MWSSLKPSQRVGVVAAIDPQSSEAPVSTPWIDASLYENYMAVIQAGAMGVNGTIAGQFNQAQDAAGAGVKPLVGASITGLTEAVTNDSSTQSIINVNAAEMDTNNGYRFLQLTVTSAVAASLVAATVLGFDPHNGFASDTDAASVLQINN